MDFALCTAPTGKSPGPVHDQEEKHVSNTQTPVRTGLPETDSSPTRRKLRKLDVMVADIIQETPDTFTLVLFTGNERLEYKAGHFITIDPHQFEGIQRWTQFLEHQKGKQEPPRAYSLSSAPHEPHLAITVKEEEYIAGVTTYPPLLSPILAKRIPTGTMMEITGFTGPYVMPDPMPSTVDGVVHICAGSGVVPSFSILKEGLHRGELQHTLICSNKTVDDIIFCDQLKALEREFPDRLRVIHCLTRQEKIAPGMPNFRSSRVNHDILGHALQSFAEPLIFVCGPANSPRDLKEAKELGQELSPRFYETVRTILEDVAPDATVIKETYG
jgi:3-ketosteroid 9alpha-monooxygenase subunit B